MKLGPLRSFLTNFMISREHLGPFCVSDGRSSVMDRRAELQRLEHQLELANRVVRLVPDQPTTERLREFAHAIESRIADLHETEIEAAIRARAHRLWQRAGCPEGRDLEFWTEAERQVGRLSSESVWNHQFTAAPRRHSAG